MPRAREHVAHCPTCDALTPHVDRRSLPRLARRATCERCRTKRLHARRRRRPRLNGTTTIDLL